MASNSRTKTTMAKLARERLLQERRLQKQAKKDERRRRAAAEPITPSDTSAAEPPTADGS
jgi:hypothetical protein